MRVLFSVAASLMLMLALVGPVAAGGCKAFGAATVDGAHRVMPGSVGVAFGRVVSSVNHGAFAPDFNSVSQLVQFEHGLYCAK